MTTTSTPRQSHPIALIALICAAPSVGCDAGAMSDDASSGGEGGNSGASTGVNSTGATSGAAGGATSTGSGPPPSNGYHVEGNKIYKDSDKSVHVFHGLDRPSLEWASSGENLSAADFNLMASWGANVTRLSLNQKFWADNASYETNVDSAVKWAEAAGMDVILDLHWSTKGGTAEAAQQRMADNGSLTFWQEVATKYKGDGHILFELYNEPHDTGWAVWKNGGDSGDGFQAVGMQQLYDTVRATGAENLVLIGGIQYAYDLSGVPANRIKGYNIVYVTHPYDQQGKQAGDWDEGFGSLAATDPVMATEFGSFDCGVGYLTQLLDYMDQKQISWSGWAWYPGGCDFPGLISDWGGSPSAPGAVIKGRLGSY